MLRLAYVKSLPEGEYAAKETMTEVSEHLSALDQTFLQTIAQTLYIPYSKIDHPNDAVNAMRHTSLQKQAIAQRDARWVFGLVAFCFVVIGWFWQIIRPNIKRSSYKTHLS